MEQQLSPKDFRQIQEQISQMIDTIQQALDYPPNQSPVSYLQHYNTLLAKTRSLISALDGGSMNGGIGAVNQSSGGPQVLGKWKGLVVSPLVLHKADPEFYPRVLLRSKLIPEIESEQEEKKRMAAEAFVEPAAGEGKETTRISSVEVGLFIFFLDPCLLLLL